MSGWLKKTLLPLAILGAAIAVTALMVAHPVTPERNEVGERPLPVEVTEIVRGRETVTVTAQGTVTAAQQIQLRPEVSGRVVDLSPSLVPGGRFAAGEVIAVIDRRDYESRVVAQREAVAQARLMLREEKARQTLAEEEWELLAASLPPDETNRELALRIPQIERAEAAIAAAESALAQAELDLERCTLRSPFNAVVLSEQVDLGQLVNPQTEVATLAGTDAYWVRASLPVEHLEWVVLPGSSESRGAAVSVIHRAGAVEIRRPGRVERLLGDVDPAGRLARLLIVIDHPLRPSGEGTDLPLLIGSYVTVEIEGRSIDDAIVIPRRALREVHRDGANGAREGLWIMDDDDRLAIREAEVVWRGEDAVLLANDLAAGERLITSNIATPIVGMKLTVAEDAPPSSSGETQARTDAESLGRR